MINYDDLVKEIREEFSDFQIKKKSESNFMKVIGFILRVITFNKMKAFMTEFTTTIGNTIYVSTRWDTLSDTAKVIVLRHERIHLRQAKKYTRPLFSFLYIFVLPALWTYRSKFEREAYEETMMASVEAYGLEILSESMKMNMVRYLSSSQYFWMMPKKDAEKWFDETKKKIIDLKRED